MRFVGNAAGNDVGDQHDLGIGEQHADLGAGQRLAARLALGQRQRVRQRLDGTVELAARLQRSHEASLVGQVGEAALAHQRQRQRLLVVVGEHEVADLVGHLGQQLVARRPGQAAFAHRGGQRDLDVDLDVGRVDAAGIVDGVGIAGAALEAELDAGTLRGAEIGALADHLGAQFRRGDADRIVGAVADLLVGFATCPDIGADAAEPQQVDRRLEDRVHDLGRRRRRLVEPDRRSRLGRQASPISGCARQ